MYFDSIPRYHTIVLFWRPWGAGLTRPLTGLRTCTAQHIGPHTVRPPCRRAGHGPVVAVAVAVLTASQSWAMTPIRRCPKSRDRAAREPDDVVRNKSGLNDAATPRGYGKTGAAPKLLIEQEDVQEAK